MDVTILEARLPSLFLSFDHFPYRLSTFFEKKEINLYLLTFKWSFQGRVMKEITTFTIINATVPFSKCMKCLPPWRSLHTQNGENSENIKEYLTPYF